MHTFYLRLFTLFIVLCLASCQEKKAGTGETYIPEPPKREYDSLAQWLRSPQNLANPNYKKIFFERFEKEKQREQYDSATQTLVNYGNSLIIREQYDSTFLYTTLRFLKDHEKQLSTESYSRIVYNLGIQYSMAGSTKQDSAVYWYKKTVIKSEDYNVLRNQANAKSMLSLIYVSKGNRDSALSATQDALAIYERLRDTATASTAWISLYNIYINLSAYDEADKCLNKAIMFAKIKKDTLALLFCYFNKTQFLRSYHTKTEQELTAADTLKFAESDTLLHLYQAYKTKTPFTQFYAYYNPVLKELTKKDFALAKQYLDSCKVATEELPDPIMYINYLIIKGEYELKAKKGITDIESYKHAIADAEVSGDFATLFYMYEVLGEDAKLKKAYPLALKYTEKKFSYRDSLGNEEMRGKIFELEKKYQTEKKEQQIALQKEEIKAKNSLILSLFVSLLGICLAVAIYLLWKKQQIMKKENQQKQEFTNQLLQSTEDDRKRIAYDLHDSIGHQLLNLKRELKGDISQTNVKIDTILAEVRGISRNLHPVMFDKVGLQISLEDLVENFQNQHELFVTTDINYTAGTLPLHSELQVFRIVQEALSNIKKYAEAKAAKVSIMTNANHILLEIKDNGKGFNVAETLAGKKAFGLHSIIERAKTIKGNPQISSSSQGTLILISIPILV
jgi:two-component system, NarL family, sensor kinase